ncbi:hypothetical protein J4Q44_G00241670 [Coregonus suidteri]|uniref:Uncharacterized protein n=1 Tax=Coregonus suidteri TaxID=861788 RepID=A0AAN8L5A1_9TELE
MAGGALQGQMLKCRCEATARLSSPVPACRATLHGMVSALLSQLPVSLILNPVEIGQAERGSFDQAFISDVVTVSAPPDPREPWSPVVRSGAVELQAGGHTQPALGDRETDRLPARLPPPPQHQVTSLSISKHCIITTEVASVITK